MKEVQIEIGDVLVLRGIRMKALSFRVRGNESWTATADLRVLAPSQTNPNEGASMNTLQVGDVVQLNSGGPRMTVNLVWSDRDVECAWNPGDKPVLTQILRQACLKLIFRPIAREPSPLEMAAEEYRLAVVQRERALVDATTSEVSLKTARDNAAAARERLDAIARGETEQGEAKTA